LIALAAAATAMRMLATFSSGFTGFFGAPLMSYSLAMCCPAAGAGNFPLLLRIHRSKPSIGTASTASIVLIVLLVLLVSFFCHDK
jgi:hypothetical protein